MPDRVGGFRSESARAHFLAAYRAALARLPPIAETHDVPTSFGTVRMYRFAGDADGPPVLLLPGRNASTPVWRDNIAALLERRPVLGVDLLGEAGMSVQHKPITGPDDEARWLDEALAGLGVDQVHLMGLSIGGWTATNYAARRPGRAASLVLLDPVLTFAPIAARAVLASPALFVPGVPTRVRRRVQRWIGGGHDVDDTEPVAALIAAGATDYALRKAMPRLVTDEQLRGLDIPVLALIAGRSVMHDAARAERRAKALLARGEVEVWPYASHAINGEYVGEIADRAGVFWERVDG
ncbi:alpha/beta fold hydrolase [Mycolicibacterium phlei]